MTDNNKNDVVTMEELRSSQNHILWDKLCEDNKHTTAQISSGGTAVVIQVSCFLTY